MAFKSLPIIDLSLADDPATKPQFLEDLKYALFRVGFLYLVNHGVEQQARDILELTPKAFDVPQEAKDAVAMTRNPYFVGYNRFGNEVTATHTDFREQYDFGTADSTDPLYNENSDEEWRKIFGPTEYLPDSVLPGFEKTVKNYLFSVQKVAQRLVVLVAECLGLPPDTFSQFENPNMDRLKLVKYPPPNAETVKQTITEKGASLHNGTKFQGVGPHKDSSNLFTFVLQDKVGGLEVLNQDGEWIPAKPIEDSFVVNIAQGFEALTGGRCGATTHQVVSPPENVTRYSVPYFHAVRMDLTKDEIKQQLKDIEGVIPEPSDSAKRAVDVPSEFIDPQYKNFGEAHLRNRVVSHKDVAEIWYPELHKKYNLGIVN